MNVFPIAFDFLAPYCAEGDVRYVTDPADADFLLTMNQAGDWQETLANARRIADTVGKPLCWWSIEDPNSHLFLKQQATYADFVFTSDREVIPSYRQAVGHNRVYWLPLAASKGYHRPFPLADDAADFVFSGNWYDDRYQARRWGTETVILPLARAGYSMAIFSYEEPPYPELKPFWRGSTNCRTVADQYTHGRIVLGNNCQRSGFDGIEKTAMCSMRVFEALACGKVLLAPFSDAYEALGFSNGDGIFWVHNQNGTSMAYEAIREFGPQALGAARQFVLANHLYHHRLQRIASAIDGAADPMDWRP